MPVQRDTKQTKKCKIIKWSQLERVKHQYFCNNACKYMHYCVAINCVLFEPCETLLKVKIKYFV